MLQDIERKILAVRRKGYARNNGELTFGINTVAMVLRHPSGQAFAGVSVPVPTPRFEERAIPHIVQSLTQMVDRVRIDLAEEVQAS